MFRVGCLGFMGFGFRLGFRVQGLWVYGFKDLALMLKIQTARTRKIKCNKLCLLIVVSYLRIYVYIYIYV